MSAYLNFILRALPEHETPSGVDTIENFVQKTAFWSAFFSALFMLVPYLTKKFAPKWYGNLPERKIREYPSYVVCLIHHLTLVPRAWVHIFADFVRTEAELAVINYAVVEASVAPFCLGYLIGDTLCFAIPELISRGKMEYMIHHVFTVWLIVSTMYSSGHLTRFIPHLLICDTTNVFFNIAWLLRAAGYEGSWIVSLLEILFAVFFLCTRAINMPTVFLAVGLSKQGQSLGIARLSLIPIALMQWYWFYKIVATLSVRLRPKKAPDAAKKADKLK